MEFIEIPLKTNGPIPVNQVVPVEDVNSRRELYVSDKAYILNKSQREGEVDLMKISEVLKSYWEYAWYFEPESETWIFPPNQEPYCEWDMEGIRKTGSVFPDVNFPSKKSLSNYHLHTRYNLEHDLNQNIRENDDENYKKFMRSLLEINLILPSPTDLKSSFSYDDYDFHIATPFGITDFKTLSEDASEIDFIDLMDQNGLQTSYFISYLAFGREFALLGMISRLNKKLEGKVKLDFRNPLNHL